MMRFLGLAAIFCIGLSSCSKNPQSTEFRVGLVTPGPFADAAWNSGAYAGLQQIHDSLAVPISHVEACLLYTSPSPRD